MGSVQLFLLKAHYTSGTLNTKSILIYSPGCRYWHPLHFFTISSEINGKFPSFVPVSSWLSAKILDYRLSQPGFDPSFRLNETGLSVDDYIYIYKLYIVWNWFPAKINLTKIFISRLFKVAVNENAPDSNRRANHVKFTEEHAM